MPDLADGDSTEMKGSGAKPYVLKNTGGVYSCSCPAWRNQSIAIERRTCKHLRKLRGDAAEEARIGGALPQKPVKAKAEGEEAGGLQLLLAVVVEFIRSHSVEAMERFYVPQPGLRLWYPGNVPDPSLPHA